MNSKVTPVHLQRGAVVYVRQSTLGQVAEHTGHQVTHFRVFHQRALQFPIALVGQIVAEEARE